MPLSSLFAKRYLLSKKSHSVINIISRVSSVAVGVPVAAMVILLSVFNGFEGLVKGMYNDFDPDIMVSVAEGKIFPEDGLTRERVLAVEGVEQVSAMLEDNALLEYRGRQYIAAVRGVDTFYRHVVPIESMLVEGGFDLWHGDMMQAVVGRGLAYNLGVRPALLDPVNALIPRRGGSFSTLLPIDSYRQEKIYPTAIFALEAQTDGKYMLAPIEFARELFDYPGGVSALMVKVGEGYSPDKVRAAIAAEAGDGYTARTRYQQNASLYKIMTYEKWGIFLIAVLVLVIASFSLIGSLVMLIIDKRGDMRTLIGMGGSIGFVRSIFVREGMLISALGGIGGMAVGLLVCWVQVRFGVVGVPESFVVDSYPVEVKFTDMLAIAAVFIAVNYIITKFTVAKMIPRSDIRL